MQWGPQTWKYYSWGGWLCLTVVAAAPQACRSLYPSKWVSGGFLVLCGLVLCVRVYVGARVHCKVVSVFFHSKANNVLVITDNKNNRNNNTKPPHCKVRFQKWRNWSQYTYGGYGSD